MSSSQIDIHFAKAWDLSRGYFSKNLAEKILVYIQNKNIKVKKALDICCGCANLLDVFHANNIKCIGTETRNNMIEYSQEKYPEINFAITKEIYEMPIKSKVDLITCNQDIINYLETFDEWKTLFRNASKHLSNHGMFIFDFYTKHKLCNWNEVTYSTTEPLDCITTIRPSKFDKTLINYTYFVNMDSHMTKTKDIVLESYFETNDVINELKNAGFKKILIVDENLNEIPLNDYIDRMHIIAFKK